MNEEIDLLDQVEIETDMPQPSAREQLVMLVQSGRKLIEAEIEYIRGRLNYSGQIVKQAGLLGALSLFSLFGAVIALILGLLLILSSYIGPEIATLAVTITFASFALLFALLARRSARKLAMPELSRPEFLEDELDG
jgi:Putative Actinobacterial Holin-X, holin superfamily III